MEIRYNVEDTICALSTPYGQSALAIVRLSGLRTYSIISKLVDRQLPERPAGRHFMRKLKLRGELHLDSVLICYQAPHSFTGEDMVEISTVGNPLITTKLMDELIYLGARQAEPGEFSFRAYLNGKLDLAQAEAINDAIRAGSESALRLALNQLAGELSEKVRNWLDRLNSTLAAIEVIHDYPGERADATLDEIDSMRKTADKYSPAELGVDEETFERMKRLPPDALVAYRSIHQLSGELKQAIDFYNRYARLREGLKVVILGAPNVGKSTLFNSLLGYERAIVTAVAGTTRDYIEEKIEIRGVNLYLVDTAGLRQARDVVEMLGIERTKRILAEADAVILMEDVNHFFPLSHTALPRLQEILKKVEAKKIPHLIVINKSDLLGVDKASEYKTHACAVGAVLTSCTTHSGLDEVEKFLQSLVEVKEQSLRFLLNARQNMLTKKALASLTSAKKSIREGFALDAVSIDLYDAQRNLAQILSLESKDMVLEQIFSSF